MSVRPRVRFEVLKRDGFRCAYCGRVAESVDLQVDHIVARASGGSDEMENLVTACRACNAGKSDRALADVRPVVNAAVVEELAERVGRTERYAHLAAKEREVQAWQVGQVMARWAGIYNAREEGTQWVLDSGTFPDERSIRRILDRLPLIQVLELMDRCTVKFRWPNDGACRYFYGACWRVIREADAPPKDEAADIDAYIRYLKDELAALAEAVEVRDERIEQLLAHECPHERPRNYDIPKSVGEILRAVQ